MSSPKGRVELKTDTDPKIQTKETKQTRQKRGNDCEETTTKPRQRRQALLIQEGRGAEVRSIKGKTDNEAQLKIQRQQKKRQGNRNSKVQKTQGGETL